MAAIWDSVTFGSTGANASYTIAVTIPSQSNVVLVVLTDKYDTGTVSVSGVSGGGGTWSKFGSTLNGNTNMQGECWVSIPTLTGAQTITVTYTAAPSSSLFGHCIALYNANQTTPLTDFVVATSGDLVITSASGDVPISTHIDTVNNRSVTGCTSSTDESAFGSVGHSATHCAGSASTTFTWSGYAATSSIGMGVNVQQVAVASGVSPVFPSSDILTTPNRVIGY